MKHPSQLEVFFDGECPLCLREINFIRWLDRNNAILFTDISDPEFDTKSYGKTMDALMDEIHARLHDGSWITGVEVFRRLYSAVGFGWIVAPTRLPILTQCLDFGYRVFAKNRLKWTGRCSGENSDCSLSSEGTKAT